MVKIYSITATNAVDGVASSCRACALGSEQSGSSCVPCPPGHYIEKETNQCKECPPGTYLSMHQVYGKEACIPCGPGSKSTRVSGSASQLSPQKHVWIGNQRLSLMFLQEQWSCSILCKTLFIIFPVLSSLIFIENWICALKALVTRDIK
jgi:hypothetical protein